MHISESGDWRSFAMKEFDFGFILDFLSFSVTKFHFSIMVTSDMINFPTSLSNLFTCFNFDLIQLSQFNYISFYIKDRHKFFPKSSPKKVCSLNKSFHCQKFYIGWSKSPFLIVFCFAERNLSDGFELKWHIFFLRLTHFLTSLIRSLAFFRSSWKLQK